MGTRRSRAVIVQPRRSRTVILRPGRGAPAVVRYWTGFGPGFLGDLAAFYSACLACAVPTDVCVDGHGRPVVRCQGEVVVSAHRFLAGAAPAVELMLTSAGVRGLARALSALHRLPAAAVPPSVAATNALAFTTSPAVLDELGAGIGTVRAPWAPAAAADLAELRAMIEDGRFAALPHAAVHGDLRTGNLALTGDTVTLYDFEYVSLLPRIVDVTGPVFLAVAERHGRVTATEWLASVVRAYGEVADRPLTSEERRLLPRFADFNHLFHGVGLYLTYLADPDTPAPRVRDKARRVAAYYLARRR